MSIKQYLPAAFRRPELTNMNAIIAAIQSGDDHVLELLTEARRQLFLTTASGSYLTNLANQYGFAVPPNSGLDGSGFRDLSIPAIWSPKQSIPTINKIAELFYSSSVLHPYTQATQLDHYSLSDGDTLLFETEDGIISILFEADKFADISSISASEIASTINSQAQGRLIADAVLDRVSQKYYARVISQNFGSAAKIRCAGGSAQNVIKFQDVIQAGGVVGTTWNITKKAFVGYSNVVRFTWDGVGTNPATYNLSLGDNVSIIDFVDAGPEFSKLNGSYEVIDAGSDYFEIRNIDFQSSGVSYTQTAANQIVFTSQKFRTLFDNAEYAVVSETAAGVLDISVPAVPPIVRRPLQGATRLRGGVENILSFGQNTIIIPHPNKFPDAGTVVIDTDRFLEGFNKRYYKYQKNPPSGPTQALSVVPGGNQVPFVSPAQASTALSVIQDLNPILGTVDDSDIVISTPPVGHYFENGQEITIQDASISVQVVKHKTVPSIYCPPGQDNHYFENDMDSDRLYIQFWTEDTKELAHLVYKPDPADPTNRTRFYYLPELEGRFIRAVICEMSPGNPINDVTATLGPNTLNVGGGTSNFTHSFGTPFVTFMAADATDGHNVTGAREIPDSTNLNFIYSEPSGVSQIKAYALDYQNVYPSLVRAVAANFYLPASPTSVTSRTVVHNLFSSSLIVELKVTNPTTSWVPDNQFLFFPKIVIIDDTKFEIQYDGLQDDLYVDVYILASYFNPIESVHGGILPSELNGQHVVRRRIDEYNYAFEIFGTGPAPFGSGTITTLGKNVNGVGTQFLTEVSIGDFIFAPDGQKRLVTQIFSDTSLKLSQAFNPSIATPSIYKICSPDANDTPYGEPVRYFGAILFGFNVTFDPDTNRGTDIRFVFPDRVSRATAGFVDGSAVKLLADTGFDVQPSVAKYLRDITLTVHSQENEFVYFRANIGALNGVIIQNAKCRRSGYFGGSNFKHYLQIPLSTRNTENWFKDNRVFLIDTDLPPNDQYAGSYVYDVSGAIAPYTVGAIACKLTNPVTRLSAPGVLDVDDVTKLPKTGYLFLDFGSSAFEGPIAYNLLTGSTPGQIRIDPAYVFKQNHADNSVVRIAASISKAQIKTDGSQFPVYVTGTVEARKTLEQILKELVSVGVKLNLTVQLPELRFYETSIQPFT